MKNDLTAQNVAVITERLSFRPFVDDTRGIVEQLNVCVMNKASGLKHCCYVVKAHTWKPALLLSGKCALRQLKFELKSFQRHAR